MDNIGHDAFADFFGQGRNRIGATVAYKDDYALSGDIGDFFGSVVESLCAQAVAIQNESAATANHAARSAFALRVLADPKGFARMMMPGLIAGGSLTSSSTDAAIDTRVSAVWNAYCVNG